MATTTHGGAREGAGRKTTREKYASAITRAEKKIADNLPRLVDKMLELAEGVTVQEVDPKTGETNVYEKQPDFRAASYLLDRIMGKPVTAIDAEITGGNGGALLVAFSDKVLKVYGDNDEDGPESPGDETGS